MAGSESLGSGKRGGPAVSRTNARHDRASAAPADRLDWAARCLSGPINWRTVRHFSGHCVFVGGFLAVLFFFNFIDVEHNHYFEAAYSGVYNAFRIVFIAYLFWIIYFIGYRLLLFVAGGQSVAEIGLQNRLALAFFVGAAALTIVMLPLGYLSLYWRAVAALATIPVVIVSSPHFSAVRSELRSAVARHIRQNPIRHVVLSGFMLLAALFFGGVLLLVKGLYPQGGHDYYLHYSQFYAAVIDNHGIWPNDIWYQYYYSKGLGVMFLGILLSDALAPSLVTYCFVIATAIALYSLVHRFRPCTLWPWVAVTLYLALNVHTLGTGFYAANGGWGHFQKPHELNAPVLIAIMWMSVNMVRSQGDVRLAWWFGAALWCFAVTYLLIISSAIVGAFCLLAAVGSVAFGRANGRAFIGLAASAGLGLASVLVLNYLTTGMPSDVGLNIWWPIIDFYRLSADGTLFDVTNGAFRRAQAVATGVSFAGFDVLEFINNAGRFDILGSMMYGALAGAVIGIVSHVVVRYRLRTYFLALDVSNVAGGAVVLAFLVATVLFTFAVGAGEPVSYVRLSSFSLPLMLAVAAIVWQLTIASVKWPWAIRELFIYLVPIALAAVTLVQDYDKQRPTLLQVLANAIRFVGGEYSIYDAYKDQAGWPALPDSRAIYPGIYEAWKTIGPGQRLWSFNVHSYCMVPGCRVESHLSSKMLVNRAAVLFGTPEVAKAALQRAGLNYFFISTYLDIRDPLICTPLFSPDTIRDHLGVKWTDGKDVLLTWKGPGIDPLSAQWVDRYRAALKASPHTPNCDGDGPPFSYLGRRVHEEVMKGKRWGAQIAQPR
jgi:hypothetical protein